MRRLHIDIETYSSVDIKACGLYRYVESPDFQIQLLTYAYDGETPVTIDLVSVLDGETIPTFIEKGIYDPTIIKVAHNATFERVCLSKHFGKPIPVEQWECTMIKAAYCGLPLGLDAVAEALKLNARKDAEGKALIKYFSTPCKPTRTNGGRTRNMPEDDLERWARYKEYNNQDVVVEREIDEELSSVEWPSSERVNYLIDATINDRGISIDRELAEQATALDEAHKAVLSARIAELTGLDNPNSAAQMKAWLSEEMGEEVESLNKDFMKDLIQQAAGSPAEGVLRLRQQLAKSSTAKYISMLNCRCQDGRARGLFQFYGANRTGRFAGRLIQLQNLPQNHIEPLALARQLIREGDGKAAEAFFGNLSSTLSQLIRTAFIPRDGHVLAVADFSAIEARVLAWLAQEQWRMDVFATTGKIYEASAEMMFHQPKGSVDKSSPLRQRGKVAELALGYGGGVNALTTMDKDGSIPEDEKQGIVDAWRLASPAVVALWKDLERCSFGAVGRGGVWTTSHHGIEFRVEGKWLTIRLPNGRKLYYREPEFTTNRFGSRSLRFKAMDQTTHKWGWTETYAGKITENCLSKNTLVLTQLGWKSIIFVDSNDLIWDGQEWVKHEGLVYKGVKETITVNGVRMTHDHKILTDEGWKNASQSEGHCGAAFELPNSFELRRLGREKVYLEHSLRLWKEISARCKRISKRGSEILRLHEVQDNQRKEKDTRNVEQADIQRLALISTEVHEPESAGMGELWRSGHNSLRKMATQFRELLGGYGRRIQNWVDFRSHGCYGQLRKGELLLDYHESADGKHSKKPLARYPLGSNDRQTGFREVGGKKYYPTLSAISGGTRFRAICEGRLNESVYDLKNCGPRHRFVVKSDRGEPFIVHNCTQAIARDCLCDAMLKIERAGLPIVLHVHDEAAVEVPTENAEAALKTMLDIMAEPLPWADGLLLKGEGFITEFYKKD